MNTNALTVKEYMTLVPHSASPKQSLPEARDLMAKYGISHLPVQAAGTVVGILSARDLETVWTLAHAPPKVLTVEDAMTPDPYSVGPETPLGEAVRVMADREISSVVVIECEHAVGILTAMDAMRALADLLCAPFDVPHERESARNRFRQRTLGTARLPDRLAVDDAISVVMGTLVKRLTKGEARALLNALPNALRPFLEKAVLAHEGTPVLKLDRAEFVDRVAEHLGLTPAHAELACGAVFDAVRRELPETIVRDVAHELPRGLAQLWLADARREAITARTLSAFEARSAIEHDIGIACPLPRGVTSEDVLAAVLCTFSARLSRGQARELLLGLPESFRSIVDGCVVRRSEFAEVFGRDELLRRVQARLHIGAPQAEALFSATLGAVKRLLPEKAVLDVASQLPPDLLELWDHS